MANEQSIVTYYDTVTSKKVDWLWYPYIPYGKITIIQGDPGEGKTTLILSLIAQMSNGGHLPLSNEVISGIAIYQNTEDDIADTIKPRLENHNANCAKICFIDSSDNITLDDDGIEEAIKHSGAKLLVLDPIQSFVGENVDMNRANSIRPRMKKLKEMAERTGCAVVLIGHLNKNSGNKTNYRGLGSIDIPAAARSVLLVGKLESQPDIRVVSQMKNNLAPMGKSLAFKLVNGAVEWLGEVDMTAEELANGGTACDFSKTPEATGVILSLLADGAVSSKEIYARGKELGISERTMNKAKKKLSIKTFRDRNNWFWALEDTPKE